MPFDNAAYVPDTTTSPYRNRWSVAADGKKPEPRLIVPRSDAAVLYEIWRLLETRWSRKFNDGDNHCIVGWAANLCEPATVCPRGWSPQTQRILRRLHDALPKSAQRKLANKQYALGKYNDTRELQKMRDLVFRAYLAEVNERTLEV
jgi:hypothetical protein